MFKRIIHTKEFKTRVYDHILNSINVIEESGPLSAELIALREKVEGLQ